MAAPACARLSAATLDRLEGTAQLPAYARDAVRGGVVHFGIGAFHRAHQALVFEAMLAAGDPRWGVTGVSLRSAGVRDQLVPQDGLYTVLVREGEEQVMQVVGAVRSVLVAPEDPEAVIAALAAPDTFLVTLTVTEKGYCLDRASGTLDSAHPDVAADLAALERPRTAAGFLVAGLARRKRLGLGPLTLLSCDNLPHNGALLARSVLAMARAHDAELAAWIGENCRFPASMVDRIVPATTPEDIADLAATTGLEDRAMVKTEPFLQWVIEDSFVGESPAFPVPGVILTRDVAPWEAAKLRLLNGAHSAIAYLGGLAGDAFVHDFVASPTGRRYLDRLWDELVPTLTLPEGFDPAAYRAQLMARFANSALQHRTTQIAMDGSQKLPQRLLTPLAERAQHGADFTACALAVAGWVRWQAGRSDAGVGFAIDDPAAVALAGAMAGAADPRTRVEAALGVLDFRPDTAVSAVIAGHLDALERGGVRATLDEFMGETT